MLRHKDKTTYQIQHYLKQILLLRMLFLILRQLVLLITHKPKEEKEQKERLLLFQE